MELVFAFPFSSNYDQISSSLGCDVKKDPLSPQKIGSILVLHMHIVLGIICLESNFMHKKKKEINNLQQNISRGVVPGGAMEPPDFGRSVNPILTRGTDYAHLITTGTPVFSNLPTALITMGISPFRRLSYNFVPYEWLIFLIFFVF